MRRILIVFTLALFLATNSVSGEEVRFSTAALNLRRCPGTETCVVIRTLPPNSELEIIKKQGDWLQVRAISGGDTGWVHSRYTKETEAAMPIGAVSTPSVGGLRGKSGRACKFDQLGDCIKVGRVDERGDVFKVGRFDSDDDQRIGSVNREGKIYRIHEGFGDDQQVGFVNSDGRVYRLVYPLETGDPQLVGEVKAEGQVYKAADIGDDVLVGKVEAPLMLAGGPALLLLLLEEAQKGTRRP
jgi:hypothetical protein